MGRPFVGGLMPCGGFLAGDPGVDAVVKHFERQRARVQHLVVEGAQVELVAESLPGAIPQFQNLELAHLVGQGLAGPGDVAIHLGLDAGVVDVGVVVEVLDHWPGGSSVGSGRRCRRLIGWRARYRLRAARVGVGLIEAHVLAQPLGVEAPTLDVSGIALIFAESGNALQLLGDGNLQVMAGKALVVGDVLDAVEIAIGGVVGIDEQAARPGRRRARRTRSRRAPRSSPGNREPEPPRTLPWAACRIVAAGVPASG